MKSPSSVQLPKPLGKIILQINISKTKLPVINIYMKTFLKPLFTKALKTNNSLCFANNVLKGPPSYSTVTSWITNVQEQTNLANIWRFANITDWSADNIHHKVHNFWVELMISKMSSYTCSGLVTYSVWLNISQSLLSIYIK